MFRTLATLLLVGMVAGCASHSVPDTTAGSSGKPASAATNALAGTPMAAYGHDLNRARNVQNIVNAQAKKQAKAIDAQTH